MCSRFLSSSKDYSRKGAKAQRKPQRTLPGARQALRLCAFAGVTLLLVGCASKKDSTITTAAAAQPITRPAGVLRVCADPNNLPFSNQRGEGFENKIAELLAQDLGERVEYTWWAQRRGFFRNTLKAGMCDVVIGVPAGFEMALTTKPYYRSTYVFLSRKDRHLNVKSFEDPVLRSLRIGVQIIGDDHSNTPPAHALTRRNIVDNVKGFTLYGDYSQHDPPARIVEAVSKGDIDLAIVWGPLAGYFAKRSRVALDVVPVSPQIDQPFLPFVFDIAMGVRRSDQELRDQLDEFLEKRRPEIERLLEEYRVPKVEGGSGV
ncbi:MAG TPA: substrate-binding domain-containing protein [Pyrinomonadaceae bacterium]|nr:substrate-binding domain-containing protein [Pyrinomonadaceae bacterium]